VVLSASVKLLPVPSMKPNLHDGIADEDITYSIEGTNADKFSITTDSGILTYKAIQTLVHDNDTVTIVATDVSGNKTEQLITVSVKVIGLSTSVVWSGIGDALPERLTITV
jgi:hypothetical protein